MGRPLGSHNKIPGMTLEQRRIKKNAQLRERRQKNPERYRKWQRDFYAKHTEKAKVFSRKNRLKRKYGITPEYYDELFKTQKGVCAICRNPPKGNKALHIDHNHITGKVRGLLCLDCNVRLSVVENVEFRSKAETYLSHE